jgi:mono/diheme cytochrome c family protein
MRWQQMFWAMFLLGSGSLSLRADEPLSYNRDVRPILATNCFACHGPDSASRQADLRLDQKAVAEEMKAIVPGKPDESELLKRILSHDPEEVMPPPASKKTITPAQIETLRKWIASGAEYQPHWSFIAPVKPAIPVARNSHWVRNPIDNFVLAKLESLGLEPAAEADRRTWARRVSFDLTGLPPTPERVAAFVADTTPEAYEKYVDDLFKTPQWGEHRGRYWLDYARYADTHGVHFDNFREMWSYREWVIGAFNKNMPYDEFTIESLAGDLLPNRTLEQQIGSGFNRCNMTTNEGGIIDEEYLVLYTRDRTETVSQVWMGMTTGCAVCHDHKFDPLSQKEFYEMAAFFNNTTQGARDGNIKDTPPIVPVPLAADRPRLDALSTELPAAKTRVEARQGAARPAFDSWLTTVKPDEFGQPVSNEGLHLHAALNEGQGTSAKFSIQGEARDVAISDKATWKPGHAGSRSIHVTGGAAVELADVGDFESDQSFSYAAWIKLSPNDSQGAIASRMDKANLYRGWDFWVQARRVGTHIINAWSGDAIKVVSKEQVKANEWTHVAVTYNGTKKAAGVKIYINGTVQENLVESDTLKGSIQTNVPFKVGQRNDSDPISGLGLQDLRLYQRELQPDEVASLGKSALFSAIIAKPADQRTDAENNELFTWWLNAKDDEYRTATSDLAKLEKEQADIKARGTIAYVMQEKPEPAMAFILQRGDYDKRKDQVSANTPAVLPAFPADAPRNRLGFAKWLLSNDHPLTARVTVNRYWQEVFGTGLVKTSGDFGITGELPVNQDLLDWLAVDFRENGWDVQRLFRQIVLSSTYRQSALATKEKREKDPENRLLSRGPRFRMDAEMVRDGALASSGLLAPKIGGPSVKPYQPPGVWEAIAMDVSNTRSYQRDTGEGLYRRSMYTFWKRMAPPASMDIFNATNREQCLVRRERTNTPLQALVTLNDEQFVEAARHLAQSALLAKADTNDRIEYLAQRLISRSFRPEELAIITGSLADLTQQYKDQPEAAKQLIVYGESKADPSLDPQTLAAWTMLVNELMNLDEVLNK